MRTVPKRFKTSDKTLERMSFKSPCHPFEQLWAPSTPHCSKFGPVDLRVRTATWDGRMLCNTCVWGGIPCAHYLLCCVHWVEAYTTIPSWGATVHLLVHVPLLLGPMCLWGAQCAPTVRQDACTRAQPLANACAHTHACTHVYACAHTLGCKAPCEHRLRGDDHGVPRAAGHRGALDAEELGYQLGLVDRQLVADPALPLRVAAPRVHLRRTALPQGESRERLSVQTDCWSDAHTQEAGKTPPTNHAPSPPTGVSPW